VTGVRLFCRCRGESRLSAFSVWAGFDICSEAA
jgi:hypothetical protein